MTNLEYLRNAIAERFIEADALRERLGLAQGADMFLPLAAMIQAERDLSLIEVRALARMIANLAVYIVAFAYPDDDRFDTIADQSFDVSA
jgi:hypothetical protein